ncbi:MAG: septum formation initiator family protein [Patescibacteria group bacterium]
MSELKKNKKRIFSRKTVIAVSLILLLLFLIGLVKEAVNRYRLDKQIGDLENQIEQLEREKGQISNSIANWSEENQLEKEARLKLGLQKSGEKVVLVLHDEKTTAEQKIELPNKTIIERGSGQEQSNPQKWWQYFFKNNKK